jgi:hypothetical protein
MQVEDLRSGRRGPQRSESADLLPASAHPSLQHTMSTRWGHSYCLSHTYFVTCVVACCSTSWRMSRGCSLQRCCQHQHHMHQAPNCQHNHILALDPSPCTCWLAVYVPASALETCLALCMLLPTHSSVPALMMLPPRRHIGIRRAASGDGPSHSRTSDSGASLMPGSSGALGFEGIKEEAHEGADSPDGVTHRHSLVLNPSGGTLRTQPSNGSAAPAPVLPTAATLATGALLKALGVAQAASPSDVASPAPGTDNVYFSPVRSQLPPGVVLQVRGGWMDAVEEGTSAPSARACDCSRGLFPARRGVVLSPRLCALPGNRSPGNAGVT